MVAVKVIPLEQYECISNQWHRYSTILDSGKVEYLNQW